MRLLTMARHQKCWSFRSLLATGRPVLRLLESLFRCHGRTVRARLYPRWGLPSRASGYGGASGRGDLGLVRIYSRAHRRSDPAPGRVTDELDSRDRNTHLGVNHQSFIEDPVENLDKTTVRADSLDAHAALSSEGSIYVQSSAGKPLATRGSRSFQGFN